MNDTQLIPLSAAAQHDQGSLYPLPVALAGTGDRAANAVTALIKLGLAAEQETEHAGCIHRVDGDLRFGIFITESGLATIGLSDQPAAAPVATERPARSTKSAAVIALLEREEGATIGEDKVIRWEDREYRSLSEVARAITGTHWSGPAFFGLKRKAA